MCFQVSHSSCFSSVLLIPSLSLNFFLGVFLRVSLLANWFSLCLFAEGWKSSFSTGSELRWVIQRASQHEGSRAFSQSQLEASVPGLWEQMSCLEFRSDSEAIKPAGKDVQGIPWFAAAGKKREKRDTELPTSVSLSRVSEADPLLLSFTVEPGVGKEWPWGAGKCPCAQNVSYFKLEREPEILLFVYHGEGLIKYQYFLKLNCKYFMNLESDGPVFVSWHHTEALWPYLPSLSVRCLIHEVGLLPHTWYED